ncbi:class I SAM-dependent methyltransferase [Flavobacterium sp. NG2]|uniref:class I SAM-dependent methyltransferase n=1 Tax=Flavobacterium sp. NG2 TaxID=3097547 RepID=UPI002A83389C|nr:class I SAM-dependent methyltransferase [Flavobacterium sp. NG2]WPR70319.1 class I SAM-dependent methyltransferase [Flavobacterium sp. NG2]
MMNNRNNEYKDFWNERYGKADFVYGKEPNLFFKEWIQKFTPKSILMPADGEGRNGVYAAQLGWKVISIDLSEDGKSKTLKLAKENQVSLEYIIGDLEDIQLNKESFDAIGLIYAHFTAEKKSKLHKKINDCLKPGGIIIFEAFSKLHLCYNEHNPKVGGPKDIDMLFSKLEIISYFQDYEILLLEEKEINLKEGNYHNGKSSVIRFVGRKK